MPGVNGVLETCLYVDDLVRAESFYEGLLGFPKMHGDSRFAALNVAGRDVLLLFKRGETTQPIETPGGIIPPHDGLGPNHLAFAISASELDAWEKHLAAKGVSIESRVRWPMGGISIYFRDPDDNLVEMGTPGLWPIY
jgi:catechol 2,3-dioxygenase-like lactoylglutathione lyase family enzyme